jgi:hypothetical protein
VDWTDQRGDVIGFFNDTWQWSTHIGTWARPEHAGCCPPKTRRAGGGVRGAGRTVRRAGLADARDLVAAAHAALAAAGTWWLLVFDDATDRASIEPFLPPAGDGRVWS